MRFGCILAITLWHLAAMPAAAEETDGRPPPAESEILASGAGGTLTEDSARAYVDALEFVLAQMAQPADFDAATRAVITDALAEAFPDLPPEVQHDLANGRAIFDHYLQRWPLLGPAERRDFAFTVVAVAFGTERAASLFGPEPPWQDSPAE